MTPPWRKKEKELRREKAQGGKKSIAEKRKELKKALSE